MCTLPVLFVNKERCLTYSCIMKAATLVGIDKSVDLGHYLTSHRDYILVTNFDALIIIYS